MGEVHAQDSGVTFQDVSDLLGNFENAPTSFTFDGGTNSGLQGMVWFDYDNDDDLDLFICTGFPLSNALFQNDGSGGFTDVTAAAGLSSTAQCLAVVAADFDNDGHMDLFLGEDGREPFLSNGSLLYKNNGDGTFTDVSASSGLPGIGAPSQRGVTAGDYDGDGLIDLFIAAGITPSVGDFLFKNNGNFVFSDVSVAAGVNDPAVNPASCGAVFADVNGDFLPDILAGQCLGSINLPTVLFTNNGDGTFTSSNLPAGGAFMGIAVGDIDRDGDMDIFVTSVGSNVVNSPHPLLINNGDGTFVDATDVSGIPSYEWSWSSAFVDLDNDKNLDLVFAGSGINPGFLNFNKGRLLFGAGDGTFQEAGTCEPNNCAPCGPVFIPEGLAPMEISFQPNLCFTPAGCSFRDMTTGEWSGPFEQLCNTLAANCDGCYRGSTCSMGVDECVPDLGVDLSTSRSAGFAYGDFDGDGFEDIAFMTSDYSADYEFYFGTSMQISAEDSISHVVLLKNSGNSNNVAKLRLVGSTGNANGIGSFLTFTDRSGDVQYQEVRAVTGPFAPAQQWPTFGMGQETEAEVVVKWHPSGEEEKFCVSANTLSDLVEGAGRNPNAACPNIVRGQGRNGNGQGNGKKGNSEYFYNG